MTSWGTLYSRVVNVLVRVLGPVAFLSGIVFTVWGAVRIFRMEFVRVEDLPNVAILPVGLLVAVLGAAILRTPTYRPDLGDVPWGFDPLGTKARQSSQEKRSWWTGDGV